MPDPTSKSAAEYHSVQYLRGIAAIAVVYFHTKIYLGEFAWPIGRQFGFGGVDLFFAISGFIMMVTTATRNETPSAFYLKRIVRIVPMYWGATLASALLFLLIPSAFIKQAMSFEHVFLSLLFIPHHVDGETGAAPFFKIGWTLNFEVFFYLVFGLTLFLRQAWQRLALITALFVGLVACGAIWSPTGAALGYYTSPFILEFLMGAIVGYLASLGTLRHLPMVAIYIGTALALGCVLVIGGANGDGFARTLVFGVPAACLVAFAVSAEMRGRVPSSPLLERLGNASYSIYLAHPFVLTGFKALSTALHLPTRNPIVGGAGVVLAVLSAALFGYGVYRWIERPLLTVMRSLVRRELPRAREYTRSMPEF